MSIVKIKRALEEIVLETHVNDRSSGKANLDIELISLTSIDIPTFNKDNIPENLKNIPAIKPGSRNIS